MSEASQRVLAITLGDPYSVNLEVLFPLLANTFGPDSPAVAGAKLSQLTDVDTILLLGAREWFQAQLHSCARQGRLSPAAHQWLSELPISFDFTAHQATVALLTPESSSTGEHKLAAAGRDKLTAWVGAWPGEEPALVVEATGKPQLRFIQTATLQGYGGDIRQLSPERRGWLAYSALLGLGAVAAVIETTFQAPKLAVLSAPICKYEAQLAGFSYPGQTEFFEHLWQGQGVMVLTGDRLTVGLLTNHLALRQVPKALTVELVVRKALQFVKTLLWLRRGATVPSGQAPAPWRVALCSLNPHRSDQGMFGDEEARLLVPAIQTVHESTQLAQWSRMVGQSLELVLESADTAFYKALRGDYMGVLACYHDQGLGPLKTVHFDSAVNVTGGLRHLRVSPDHGPARDLYDQGWASPASFAAALKICMRYLTQDDTAQQAGEMDLGKTPAKP